MKISQVMFAALILLAGCSDEYVKDSSGTLSQADIDMAQCKKESLQINAAPAATRGSTNNPVGAFMQGYNDPNIKAVRDRRDYMRACMAEKGYKPK